MNHRQNTLKSGTPWRGTDNLQGYLYEAVLPLMTHGMDAPPMPPPGHKSHRNILSVRPEQFRRLESMHCVRDEKFRESVRSWMKSYIPKYSLGVEDADARSGERLSVPAPGFSVPNIMMLLMPPADMVRLAVWLDYIPLATVQRVLHLVLPELGDYRFSPSGEKDVDSDIFEHILWTYPQRHVKLEHHLGLAQGSVIIVMQPPWILAPRDLERFAECRSFPPFRSGRGPEQQSSYNSKERLWGKIWDLCVRRRCPWFVVSTYVGWVFGAFSKGWTTAFVSPVYQYDSYGPTVIECLIYWLASAKALKGGWEIPKVPEPCDLVDPYFSIPPEHGFRLSVEPSESSWPGKSSAAGSSAGVEGVLSPVLSDAGLPGRDRPLFQRPSQIDLHNKVSSWMQTGLSTSGLPIVEDRPPSPALSVASTASTVTTHAREGTPDNRHVGDWLV